MVTDTNELLGQTLGTCTLQRLLGRGGMGAVYLARQSRPRRIVAVKVLLPALMLEQRSKNEFLARFRREADAIAALDHINIMPVYEYGEQGDLAFLVMPYVTGGTLREVLEKRNILSLEEVVPIIEQAAAGLDSAHAQSIVHRDLKPGNILFHADGRIVLADFGLAKVLKDVTDQESSNGHLTSVGTIVGTPEYLSPEQGTGDVIDYRTDVYSLGVVLYQMLAGRVPFTGTSPVAVAIKHTLEQAPPITRFNPQIPKNVEAVVMKAMSKAPSQRYSSAGVFAQALRKAVAETLGDRFLSVAPPLLGEHITPISPLTVEPASTATLERTEDNDEQATEATQPKTANVNPNPNMSTMLMEEDESEAGTQNGATPRLSQRTQNRIQALPTLITEMDATFANQPRPAHLPVPQPQSPLRQPARKPEHKAYPAFDAPVKRQEYVTDRPAQWRTKDPIQPSQQHAQVRVFPEPQARHYQNRSKSSLTPRLLAIAGGIIALLIVIVGVSIFNTQQNAQQQGSTLTPGATHNTPGANTQTPATATTIPGSKTNAAYTLPAPVAPGYGDLLYSTNYPGDCDPKGGKWENTNVRAICGPDSLHLTGAGTEGGTSGAMLTQLPNGQQLPASYYVQFQVKMNTSNSQFGLNFHKTADSSHAVMFTSSTWATYYSDKNGSNLFSGPTGLNGLELGDMDKTMTVDIIVRGGVYNFYINGISEGNATSSFASVNQPGSIGLAIAPGSNVSFKNLAIYTA